MQLIAVGRRLPEWVYATFSEYNKRLPDDYRLELVEVPTGGGKGRTREGEAMARLLPDRAFVVLLDERGRQFSSLQLARNINKWRDTGRKVSFIIGGADGVDDCIRQRADITWSLSNLTLPHALVRVILAEQIYRSWSISNNHPYHRE